MDAWKTASAFRSGEGIPQVSAQGGGDVKQLRAHTWSRWAWQRPLTYANTSLPPMTTFWTAVTATRRLKGVKVTVTSRRH